MRSDDETNEPNERSADMRSDDETNEPNERPADMRSDDEKREETQEHEREEALTRNET